VAAGELGRPDNEGATMKAVQMTEQGGPEVLQLVELPDPQPGPGEVLIKVDAAAVNFSDLMRRRGDVYPVPTPVPFVPGAEVAGTVAAVGEGVDLPLGRRSSEPSGLMPRAATPSTRSRTLRASSPSRRVWTPTRPQASSCPAWPRR
jgi:hypothetical protein